MNAELVQVQIGENTVIAIQFRLCKLKFVKKLPVIDKNRKAPLFVYWQSSEEVEGGEGDGQVWAYFPGASYYVPMQRISYHNGVPSE